MVHGGSGRWEMYDAWNQAVHDVLFPERDEPGPVYMDFEDDVLDELGTKMQLSSSEVEAALCAAVKETLGTGGPADIFARHMSRVMAWRRGGRAGVPPFLALLAVFCIAAEQMEAGDGMAPSNYFGRLRRVMGYDKTDTRIDTAYRRVAERLWGSLNGWLLDLDGRRGLPTAYALSYRFVGLTMSQALVRKADRDRFNDFFRRFGFAPGADVPPHELETVLDAWLSEEPSPVSHSLQRLWKRGQAREKISQVAAVALANWDGSVAERRGPQAASGHLLLGLQLGGTFSKSLALQALLYLPAATTPRDGVVLTATPPQTVEMVPEVQGALGLGRSAELHPEDVLEGVLRIKDTLTGAELERRPRRLVLFRQDEITRRWIESPQVQLLEHATLLAHKDLVPRLEAVLSRIARPGWQVRQDAYRGQPDQWVVVTGVEVFDAPGELVKSSGMDDLSPLVPLTTSQLKVSGGFALPGATRGKWHSWHPPEISAVSDAPAGFEVRVVDVVDWGDEGDSQETVLESVSDDGAGVVVLPMSDLQLEDGDYRVEMVDIASGETMTATTVRLRSSDTPDARQWASVEPVSYHPMTGLGALGVPTDGPPSVRGVSVEGARRLDSEAVQMPEEPWWVTSRAAQTVTQAGPMRLAMPDPDSCIYTGAHREQVDFVPTDAKGKPLVAWYNGRCSGCGLVRRYSSRPKKRAWHKAVPDKEQPVVARHDLSDLPPTTSANSLDWETALDALMHTGGGTWSQLERVALQLTPTALFVDQFARSLEAMGHLDVRREAGTLQPQGWEVAPTALSGTEDGYLFVGHWPSGLYQQVAELVEEEGGEIQRLDQTDGPASYFALPRGELATLLGDRHTDVTVTSRTWEELAAALPPLSRVLEWLPRHEASLAGAVKWFNVRENRWVPATDLGAIGGYRVTRFSTVDLVRSKHDLDQGTVARSTVQLSKHLAALLTDRPMLAYRPTTKELVVPLGADLPGLYGRAAVAASGGLPVPDVRQRLLVYRDVPPELAQHLHTLFAS